MKRPSFIASLSPTHEFWSVIVFAFGDFIWLSTRVAFLDSTSSFIARPGDLYHLVVYELVKLAFIGWLLRARGWCWQDFGWRFKHRFLLVGVGLYILAYLFYYLNYFVLSYLVPAQTLLWDIRCSHSWIEAIAISIVNPIYEEFLVVAYLIRSREAAWGMKKTIAASILIRLLYHSYQGAIAIASTIPFGMIMAYYYWRWRKLLPLFVAHAMADLLPLATQCHLY